MDTDEQGTDNWQLSSRVDIKGEEGGYQTASVQAITQPMQQSIVHGAPRYTYTCNNQGHAVSSKRRKRTVDG